MTIIGLGAGWTRCPRCPLWVISGLSRDFRVMSALPPIADIRRMSWHEKQTRTSVGGLYAGEWQGVTSRMLSTASGSSETMSTQARRTLFPPLGWPSERLAISRRFHYLDVLDTLPAVLPKRGRHAEVRNPYLSPSGVIRPSAVEELLDPWNKAILALEVSMRVKSSAFKSPTRSTTSDPKSLRKGNTPGR